MFFKLMDLDSATPSSVLTPNHKTALRSLVMGNWNPAADALDEAAASLLALSNLTGLE